MITEFNPKVCKSFSEDVMAAIAAVAEKHGVTVEYKGTRFSAQTAELKIEAVVVGGKSREQQQFEADYAYLAEVFDLPKNAIGKTFIHGGKKLTVLGANGRASKKPIVLSGSDGKQYTATVALVKALLVA